VRGGLKIEHAAASLPPEGYRTRPGSGRTASSAKPVHQPRYRRDWLGELVQIDGSEPLARGPQPQLHAPSPHLSREHVEPNTQALDIGVPPVYKEKRNLRRREVVMQADIDIQEKQKGLLFKQTVYEVTFTISASKDEIKQMKRVDHYDRRFFEFDCIESKNNPMSGVFIPYLFIDNKPHKRTFVTPTDAREFKQNIIHALQQLRDIMDDTDVGGSESITI
jgi:hypothetical protein